MDNYFKDTTRMSNSRYKSYLECPAKRFAMDKGSYEEPFNINFLIGSYVEAFLLDDIEEQNRIFAEHEDKIFTKKGLRLAKFKEIDILINSVKQRPEFMKMLTGLHQQVVEFNLDGFPWKSKIDIIQDNIVVDLKTSADLGKKVWSKEWGTMVPFYYAYGYDIQMALYQYATGKDPYLAIVEKKAPYQCLIMEVPYNVYHSALNGIIKNQEQVFKWANSTSIEELPRCEVCDYCKSTKLVKKETMLEISMEEGDVF